MHYRHTDVMQVNATSPEKKVIEYAASLLRGGELVVFPTETVYGLGADALQSAAVERIFAAKGRPYSDPLIVHIAEVHALEEIAVRIPPAAHLLAQAFWPGPLTLILPAAPHIPARVTSGLTTVAVRMPRHPVALALIRATGAPLAAPSANRFMHVSPTTAQHALADLNQRIPLILDGGPCEVGVESTILDLSADVPTILRPGGMSVEALRRVMPEIRLPGRKTVGPTEETDDLRIVQKSPGQLLTHYAPRVPTLLFEGDTEALHAAMLAELQKRQMQGEVVGILLADEDVPFFQHAEAQMYTVGSVTAPEKVATRLFAGLRFLEDAGVQVILCRNFTEQGLGLAIRDRLLKAAGGKVMFNESTS